MSSPASKCPIVFDVRGFQTDVRLQVFDTEFHVTSAILKMHSAFFFKFLDSPDKPTLNANSSRFKYEWDTCVEKDGSWALQVASSIQASDSDLEALYGDKDDHTNLFHKLLSAMHGEPYEINTVSDLEDLTDLADYYCALPALSKSILQPLLRNRLDIKRNVVTLINIAFKLRHEILFREAVIFLAGNWTPDGFEDVDELDELDDEITRAVRSTRNKTGFMVAELLQALLKLRSIPILSKQLLRLEKDPDATLPEIISCINNGYEGPASTHDSVKRMLKGLMENCIVLHKGHGAPGEGTHKNYFLCSRVSDDDIPWDRSQKDF